MISFGLSGMSRPKHSATTLRTVSFSLLDCDSKSCMMLSSCCKIDSDANDDGVADWNATIFVVSCQPPKAQNERKEKKKERKKERKRERERVQEREESKPREEKEEGSFVSRDDC